MELKPCPFCGSPAEIRQERSITKVFSSCKTKKAAQEKLQEQRKLGTVIGYEISPWETCRGRRIYPTWRLAVEIGVFVPKCCNTKCIARVTKTYYTADAATTAWNRRAGDD